MGETYGANTWPVIHRISWLVSQFTRIFYTISEFLSQCYAYLLKHHLIRVGEAKDQQSLI